MKTKTQKRKHKTQKRKRRTHTPKRMHSRKNNNRAGAGGVADQVLGRELTRIADFLDDNNKLSNLTRNFRIKKQLCRFPSKVMKRKEFDRYSKYYDLSKKRLLEDGWINGEYCVPAKEPDRTRFAGIILDFERDKILLSDRDFIRLAIKEWPNNLIIHIF